jgi:hypothetical protein
MLPDAGKQFLNSYVSSIICKRGNNDLSVIEMMQKVIRRISRSPVFVKPESRNPVIRTVLLTLQ